MRLAPLGPVPYDGPEFPGLAAEQYGLADPSELLAGLTRALMERIGQGRARNLLLVDARPFLTAGADPGRSARLSPGGLWILIDPTTATEFGLAREMVPFLYHLHLPAPSREFGGTRRAVLGMVEDWLRARAAEQHPVASDAVLGHWLRARAAERKALALGFAHEEWAQGLLRGEPIGFPAPPEEVLSGAARVQLALALTACLVAEPEVTVDGRILAETQAAFAARLVGLRRDFPWAFGVAHPAAHLVRASGLESEEGLREAFLALLTRTPLLQPLGLKAVVTETGLHLRFLSQESQRAMSRPGRNAPCPCGSGKKFTRCCGA